MYVVDASVVYKWFVEEGGSDRAGKILKDFVNGAIELSAPDLLYYEIANALRWNKRNQAADVKSVMASLDDLDLDIIVPTAALIQNSIDVACQYKLSVYDAIYVSLAESLGFEFITADRKLFDLIEGQINVRML
ncbi:type II toxin-antitoxin system VapC family toxin [Candidatus Saganbacteria bacterium]|nr:type II toxin-antitoxin system VapC family toxin [Candidatus Saganbacteria bacterium]